MKELDENGYVLLRGVFSCQEMERARATAATLLDDASSSGSIVAQRDSPASGLRNLLALWPNLLEFIRQPVLAQALREVLGPEAGLVRGLYFDKPPGHTWALPWHRDLTIAVKQHGVLGRFKRPTMKAGVPHVEAPREILSDMLTARIHLDPMIDANGPLRVQPRSHSEDDPRSEPVNIHCEAGDVLLMRPLLSHSSAAGDETYPGHRRIVHLEFAPKRLLPDGYEWHDFVEFNA